MAVLRNALVFSYALIVQLSVFQFALLFGFYSPVGVVLTASAMPYAPPLSIVFLLPEPPRQGYAGWAVALADAQLFGVGIKIPVFHRFIMTDSCLEDIPNAKAALTYSSPVDNLVNQLTALLPPWPEHVRACPYRPAFRAAFVMPAWVFIPLMIFALRYKLYYRFRRVW